MLQRLCNRVLIYEYESKKKIVLIFYLRLMMSDSRQKLSGAQYRKKAKEKLEREKIVISPTLKVDTFFLKKSKYDFIIILYFV